MHQAKKCILNCGNFGSANNNGMCNSCFSKQQKSNAPSVPSNGKAVPEAQWFSEIAGCEEEQLNKHSVQFKKGKEGNLIVTNIKTKKGLRVHSF